ncbi:tetratricopeptide repeat protein [Lentisalinibacter orientalis]|uniref:tetratricopeptide repeat protein n=1 Tax=Lentisalinibacter orientalis TaxID=2992241 RepID=UPI00386E305B
MLKRLVIFAIVMLVMITSIEGNVQAAVGACDRLAGHPADPERVTAGVGRSDMDLTAAEEACRTSVAEYPEHARSQYHLGRVLYYQGHYKEALPHLKKAAEYGYAQAIFVLGYIRVTGDLGEKDYCSAGEYWLDAAALDHPWSGYFLADAAVEGRFSECAFDIDDDQIRRFAALAADHITISASAGRVEELLKRLSR